MLDKQIQIYSVDTSCFHLGGEDVLYNRLSSLRRKRTLLNQWADRMKQKKSLVRGFEGDTNDESLIIAQIEEKRKRLISEWNLNQRIASTKETYINLIAKNETVRTLDPECLKEFRIISVFDSALTRACEFESGKLYTDMFVVEVYFYDIMKQLVLNGCYLNGEKYIYAWSSAAQVRTKKIVMIRESLWNKISSKLMCGLSEERINAMGGVNTNKYLVYLALSSSATDPAPWFDIERSIVVDDFETTIKGRPIDYVNYRDYSVTRTTDHEVTITHTDGCGMISPELLDRCTMVRAPWLKGLLVKFDFKRFIAEFGGNPVIKDIWGDEHNIFEEDIQIIFTKSQLKMWKYYKSWEEYKTYFRNNGCELGLCNLERDTLPHAPLSYQPLQTITDFTEKELKLLVRKSNETLLNLSKNKDTMIRAFGADEKNNKKSPYQEALSLYPELLRDAYSKFKLRQIKTSLVRQYKAGKVEVNGRYLFLSPDLFAACCYWFLDDDNPDGLLADGEVHCGVYPKADELCLIRSPHLFREHCIRKNIRDSLTDEYFDTRAVYVSCHDLISQVLMCDWDGDTALTIADKFFVDMCKRNIEKDDIVPLQYELKNAPSEQVSQESKADALLAAFATNTIGIFANKISKIWSNTDWASLNKDERKRRLDLIRFLCMQSNASIDSAKTRWVMPKDAKTEEEIRALTKTKVPHFFLYAKGKDHGQVHTKNETIVNRLEDLIVNPRLSFKLSHLDKPDYHKLMYDPNIEIDERIINKYNELGKKYHYRVNISAKEDDISDHMAGIVAGIQAEFKTVDPDLSIHEIADMLIKYIFREKGEVVKKDMFWAVFGEQVVKNLRRNLPERKRTCRLCGKELDSPASARKYCPACAKEQIRVTHREWERAARQKEYSVVTKGSYNSFCGQIKTALQS